jgi:hypothetical protein
MSSEFTPPLDGARPISHERRQWLEELIDDLRALDVDAQVTTVRPKATGATWYDVTLIYLGAKVIDAATGHIVGSVLDAVVARVTDWAKRQLARRREPDGQLITLYGPDGQELRTVQVRRGPEDSTADH